MKRLAIFLACLPLAAQLNLVNPTTSGIYAVSSYNSATPVQLTMASAPSGWTVGTKIWCVGLLGLPAARNKVVEVKTISGNLVTLRTTAGVDIPGSTGGGIDISIPEAGTQVGHCAAVQSTTLAPHPRGRIPQAGTAEYTRMMLTPSTDSTWWNTQFLVRMHKISTVGCDGTTTGTCPREEATITGIPVSGEDSAYTDGTTYTHDILNLAVAWKITGDTRYRNSALYLLRNVGRWSMPWRSSQGFRVFTGISSNYETGDWDVSAEYSSFGTYHLMETYSILRDEMTSGDRATLLQKYWNDATSSCTNMMDEIGGSITCTGTECTINDASSLSVGDVVFINRNVRQYTLAGGDFTSIVSTGSAITITLSATAQLNPPAYTSFRISGAAESSLNAWFTGSYSATTGTITLTTAAVPAGTYTDAGLQLLAPGSSTSSGNVGFARVASINTAATPDEITLTWGSTTLTQVFRAPWARVRETWQSGDCGIHWFQWHHDSHDVRPTVRAALVQSTTAATSTSIVLSAATFPEFADLTPPFTARAGVERLRVTAINAGTRTLTVERGYQFTPAIQITTTVPIVYDTDVGPTINDPDGVDGALLGRWYENKMASTSTLMAIAAIAAADDSPRAAALAEFWWNTYVLAQWRLQRGAFTGPLYAGLTNTGYYFGRWLTPLTAIQVAGLNAFTSPIDLRFSGTRYAFDYFIRSTLPGAPKSIFPYGDDGSERITQRDDTQASLWHASYLYGHTGMQGVMDYWADRWAWTGTDAAQSESWAGRLFCYDPARPTVDHTTLPRSAVFVASDTDLNGYRSTAVVHRSGWDSGNAFAVKNLLGGDHHGGYTGTGQLFVTRNEAHLIDGVGPAGSGGTDIRYQNVSTNWGVPTLTVLAGNSTVSSTWTARMSAAAGTGGALVGVESSNRYVVYPRYFTVPEGSITTTVPLLLYQTPTAQTATLTVTSANTITAYTRGGATSGALTPTTATVASVSLTGPLTAGHYLQGVVTLASAAPTGGVDVTLTSNNAQVIPTPSTVRVRAGVTTAAFFVAASAAAAGTATITATSANAATVDVSITAASPGTGTVVFFAADTNTTTGLIQNSNTFSNFYARTTPRSIAWSDGAYGRFDNSASYLSTANVGHHYRDAVLLDDFAITYDRWNHTLPGHLKVNMFQHVCTTNTDANVNQSPGCTTTQSGTRVTMVSNQYGEQVSSTTILPASANVIRIEPWTRSVQGRTVEAGNRIWVYGSQATDEDFLAVHQPQSAGDMPVTWTLLSSDSGSRVIQSAGAAPWIVAFSNNINGASSMTLQAGSYAGTANLIFTGLQANQLYSVLRDGTPLATDQTVGPDGTLRISATYGSGAFAVTSTGALPLDIISSPSLPVGVAGVAYSTTLAAAGGTLPYNWSVAAGSSLPSGLTLSSAGVLSGTVATEGNFSFTINVTDAGSTVASKTFSLLISASAPPITITTSVVPNGQVGYPYSFALTATGGSGTLSYAIQSGNVPGLTMNTAGILSGTPTTQGDYSFTVYVTDGTQNATKAFSLQILPPSTVGESYIRFIETGNTFMIIRAANSMADYSTVVTATALIDDNPVSSTTSDFGLQQRDLVLSGLTPGTTYSILVDWAGSEVSVTEATANLTGTATFTRTFGEAIGDRIQLEYKTTGDWVTLPAVSCTAPCSVSIPTPLDRGTLVTTRYKWLTAADAVLFTSTEQASVVK